MRLDDYPCGAGSGAISADLCRLGVQRDQDDCTFDMFHLSLHEKYQKAVHQYPPLYMKLP